MNVPADLLNQLIRQTPADIEAWVRQPDVPAGFNWRGLAEVAAFEALSDDPDAGLAWARVAAFAYGKLADAAVSPYERARCETAVMNLRAELTNRRGTVPGDALLDCDEIFRWFLSRRDHEFDAAARDSSHWTDLPIERVRDLHYIKNELSVLRMLDRCGSFGTPEVQRWLALWDQLP